MESSRNGELPQRNLESRTHAEQRPHKRSNSQSWFYYHDRPLPESLRKLGNRRIPNGTYGGVIPLTG